MTDSLGDYIYAEELSSKTHLEILDFLNKTPSIPKILGLVDKLVMPIAPKEVEGAIKKVMMLF